MAQDVIDCSISACTSDNALRGIGSCKQFLGVATCAICETARLKSDTKDEDKAQVTHKRIIECRRLIHLIALQFNG